MAQRISGYGRIEADRYETEAWVTEVWLPHLPAISDDVPIWEPACGSGKMAKVLRDAGYAVFASDIETGTDFLKTDASQLKFKLIRDQPAIQGRLGAEVRAARAQDGGQGRHRLHAAAY
jgi:hypothetical protein